MALDADISCPRRFATTCVLYGVAFHLWSSLVLLQFDGDVEPESVEHVNPTASNEVSRRNAAQLEEEEATFIPLTLPSLQRGELYKSTDEEWQRFAELNSKPERISKLRGMNQPTSLQSEKDADSALRGTGEYCCAASTTFVARRVPHRHACTDRRELDRSSVSLPCASALCASRVRLFIKPNVDSMC